jgi:hypothetical protein
MTMPFCRTERICSATLDNGTGDVADGTGAAEPASEASLPQREPGSSEAIAAQADPAAADLDMLRKILDRLNRILDPRCATRGPGRAHPGACGDGDSRPGLPGCVSHPVLVG